jgi:hypothetical protein
MLLLRIPKGVSGRARPRAASADWIVDGVRRGAAKISGFSHDLLALAESAVGERHKDGSQEEPYHPK